MSQSNIEITKVVVDPVTQKITGMNLNANVNTSSLTINGEEVGEVNIQANKTTTIRENGTVEIEPASGYDSMAKVTATVNVPKLTHIYGAKCNTGYSITLILMFNGDSATDVANSLKTYTGQYDTKEDALNDTTHWETVNVATKDSKDGVCIIDTAYDNNDFVKFTFDSHLYVVSTGSDIGYNVLKALTSYN